MPILSDFTQLRLMFPSPSSYRFFGQVFVEPKDIGGSIEGKCTWKIKYYQVTLADARWVTGGHSLTPFMFRKDVPVKTEGTVLTEEASLLITQASGNADGSFDNPTILEKETLSEFSKPGFSETSLMWLFLLRGDKMDIVVSNETLRSTANCQQDFSCLNGKTTDLCKVDYCVDGKVHFVKPRSHYYCSYQHTFGKAYFCACPTRKEIFNKYSFWILSVIRISFGCEKKRFIFTGELFRSWG